MKFRELLKEISLLMGYEVTRYMPLTYEEIETPLQKMNAPKITGKKVVIVPILRAGLGMVDGLLNLIPSARIGHIGMYRDEETCLPVFYYYKMPADKERMVIVTDPMLATGGSACDAINKVVYKVFCLCKFHKGWNFRDSVAILTKGFYGESHII